MAARLGLPASASPELVAERLGAAAGTKLKLSATLTESVLAAATEPPLVLDAVEVSAEKRAELESLARAVKAQVIVDAEAAAEKRHAQIVSKAGARRSGGLVDAQHAIDDGEFGVGAQVHEGHSVIVGSARPVTTRTTPSSWRTPP